MTAREGLVGAEYSIKEEVQGAYIGLDDQKHLAALVPTNGDRAPLNRSIGQIALSFHGAVQFAVPGGAFSSAAAVLTCADSALHPTFLVLARDIASRANAALARPSPRRVSKLFSLWEELLRRRAQLNPDEEIGLWGELWLLLRMPSIDGALAAWRGPQGSAIDFFGGGVGIECKTTRRRLAHHFSQEQLDRPLGDVPVFIASVWVDRDDVEGKTVNELIGDLAGRVADPVTLETALLQVGYSRADAPLYTQRLRVLEAPLWFERDSVPRVREFDAGVTSIRFQVQLEASDALSAPLGIALLAKVSIGTGG